MTQLLPALADPARDSQSVFRAVLDATAYPGRIAAIDVALTPPSGLGVAAAAVLLTLVDADVTLWLPAARADVAPWLRFHCGCSILTGETLQADFALVGSGDACPPLDTALLADPERPDITTTLIVECEALTGGPALHASGPGIDGTTTIAPMGLPQSLWAERAALRPLLPLGVDLILTAGSQLMAIPRSIRIEEIG